MSNLRPLSPLTDRFESVRSYEKHHGETVLEFIGAMKHTLATNPEMSVGELLLRFVESKEAELIASLEKRPA